jgi:hypothetical protein
LTSRSRFVSCCELRKINKPYFDMKNIFILGMLISSAAICSCQKQNSTAEAQLAQRKTELDAREEALVQREKAVAEREKAIANARIIQSQRQAPDAAEAEAERQRRIQQLPPELRALIPDRSRLEAGRAEKQRAAQQRTVQTQPGLEDARRKKMSGIAAPAPQVPEAEATSPSPSPTPQ